MAEPGFEPWSFRCPRKVRNHWATEVDCVTSSIHNVVTDVQLSYAEKLQLNCHAWSVHIRIMQSTAVAADTV